jgi:2-aminoadipate transaminase
MTMSEQPFDYSRVLRPDLPPAATRWTGFPRYNFVGGHNDEASVPVDGLVDAATRVLKREGATLAMYGLHSGPLGYRPLREFVARKVASDAGIECAANDVLITSGSLQGLDLVNQVLVSPGDTVIVEEATYGGALTRLNRAGARVVGVPVNADGMDADALARALEDLQAQGITPKYIYTIPTVQNPTGTVMSEARRVRILDLSRRFGVPVFEDECYADLVWEGRRPRAMRAMDATGRVVHIGSFSKTIAPALRVGYLIADWPLLSRILSVKTDAGSGALEQMVLAEYCQQHFDTHVQALRGTLRRKLDALVGALRHQFGPQAQFDYPSGGIFLWVGLPEPVDTTRLAQIALQADVAINPGAEWMTDAQAGRRRMRVCFAHASEDVLREGTARLAEICHREFGVPTRAERTHR